jgi:hypothetical protein
MHPLQKFFNEKYNLTSQKKKKKIGIQASSGVVRNGVALGSAN